MSNTTTTLPALRVDLEGQVVEARFANYLADSAVAKTIFKREVGFAMQLLQKDDYLAGCTPESIKDAVVNLAATGLTLNPVLQQAHLIRRNVRKKEGKGYDAICCLDPDYKGLITKMKQMKMAVDVFAQVVYTGDEFSFNYATNQVDSHVPYYAQNPKGERGDEYGVYACAVQPDGYRKYVFCPMDYIDKVMQGSDNYKSRKDKSMWMGVHRPEMMKKTAIKYLFKISAKADPQAEEVANLIHLSNFADPMEASHQITDGGGEVRAEVTPKTSGGMDLGNHKPKLKKTTEKKVKEEPVASTENVEAEDVEVVEEEQVEARTMTIREMPFTLEEISAIVGELEPFGEPKGRKKRSREDVANVFLVFGKYGVHIDEVNSFLGEKDTAYKDFKHIAESAPAGHVENLLNVIIKERKTDGDGE